MSLTPQQAAQRLLLITSARDSFHGFVKALYPDFKLAGFQEELIETLDSLEKDTLGCNRLLITMPPRHGKSWLASTLFPVYYLARKANRNVLATSYNQDLAKTFGRQTRDHARELVVPQAFPDFHMSDESKAVDDWRTTMGGGYYATGLGGSTTGRARRCGWFDAVILRRAIEINSVSGICLTKLDVLDGLDTIRICVAYKDRDGEVLVDAPTDADSYQGLQPVYEELPGWNESTVGVKSLEALPANARAYIKRIEELVEAPVDIISTGPDRNETIVLRHPYA